MKCWMFEGVISHVVFTIKNSRYDWQRIKRKKPAGFIAPTFPFFENKEEEILIKVICDVAYELGLAIAAFNFCGDHVHTVLITRNEDISKIIGHWKGKSAYLYNHRSQTIKDNSQIIKLQTNHSLWAKSYYQKIIKSVTELENVIYYVNINRKRHGLPPMTSFSSKIVSSLIKSNK